MHYLNRDKLNKSLRLAKSADVSYVRSTWSPHTLYLAETSGDYLIDCVIDTDDVKIIDRISELIEATDTDTLRKVRTYLKKGKLRPEVVATIENELHARRR